MVNCSEFLQHTLSNFDGKFLQHTLSKELLPLCYGSKIAFVNTIT